ncbi:hypothetical protein OIU74_006207 [Salix koriyanagi]|uniref:Uncharacterized protein n=1 Tax=Salix koriyanagi TaxID=2511006 RepID=A0A9Q0UDX7_9ROSI|nr:hypothetical protein OIU74_006207 [Salix koriyanagi]
MKDNTSRKAGDFHASRKGSKDLRASLDDQKTNTKNHGHEFGTNKSRREMRWVPRAEMGYRREMRWVPRAEMGYRREMRWSARERRETTRRDERRRGTRGGGADGRSRGREVRETMRVK